MTRRLRKFALTAHVIFSLGWLGAAASYLALAIAALTSQDAQMMRAAYIAMEPITRLAIVPLAFASLLSGLVMSLGTPWGLFRHYWVLFKLLLTLFAIIVLLEHISTVSFLAGVAAETDSVNPGGQKGEILHAGGGLLVLVVVTVLGIYKPRGRTLYGRRKKSERNNSDTDTEPDSVAPTSRPRWATVFGIIVFILILLFVILHLAGGGPGGH